MNSNKYFLNNILKVVLILISVGTIMMQSCSHQIMDDPDPITSDTTQVIDTVTYVPSDTIDWSDDTTVSDTTNPVVLSRADSTFLFLHNMFTDLGIKITPQSSLKSTDYDLIAGAPIEFSGYNYNAIENDTIKFDSIIDGTVIYKGKSVSYINGTETSNLYFVSIIDANSAYIEWHGQYDGESDYVNIANMIFYRNNDKTIHIFNVNSSGENTYYRTIKGAGYGHEIHDAYTDEKLYDCVNVISNE